MIQKHELRLGELVLFGEARLRGVVDGLCNDWVGIRLEKGGYVIADWDDVYWEDDA